MVNELWSHVAVGEVLQLLQIAFILRWPDHRVAVAVLEERSDHAPDPVFVLDGVGSAALLSQRHLKVLLRVNLVAISIKESEGEVTDDPHERREELCQLIWVTLEFARRSRAGLAYTGAVHARVLHLNRLGEVNDKREVLQSLFIDRTH